MPDQAPNQPKMTESVDYNPTLNVVRAHAAAAREKGEHVAAPTPLSLWALIPIGLVFLAGGTYFGSNFASGPNLKGFHYAPEIPPGVEGGAGAEVNPYEPAIWVAKGKSVYGQVCVSCHQVSGEGNPGVYPPLHGSEFVVHGDKRPAAILLHGIVGALTVKGQSYRGEMPAQGAKLTNSEIAQVLSYIRSDWGNTASLVYDDQVAALRKELAAKTTPYSEAELLQIPEDAALPPSTRPAELAAEKAAAGAPPAAAPAPAAGAPANAPAPAAPPTP